MTEQPQVTPYPKTGLTRRGRRKKFAHMVDVRAELVLRSGGRCELDPMMRGEEVHHRLRRSQGGKDTLENCVLLSHFSHHAVVHAHPDWSVRHGWLLRSGDDPALIPPHPGCGLDCESDHRP